MAANIEDVLSNTLPAAMFPACDLHLNGSGESALSYERDGDARCWGVFPIMVYTRRLRPKGVPFSGFVGYERVWISLVEVYQRVEKNWHFVL